MKMRKFPEKLLGAALCIGLIFGGGMSAQAGVAVRYYAATQMPFRDMTADEIVAEMGAGWNLGNTMDGHTGFTPGETIWQNVETTQALIKAVHDMGFNTIRIPVTWGTMIDDGNGYAIDEKWISRVQDIVDYALNMNMYVIINIHHDGAEQTGWLRVAADDFEPVKEKFGAVWGNIAERFKDYDEHLIFESMNEVTGGGSAIVQDTQRIMELNQIFVDVVRASGSNNAYRWLSVPGRYTNIYHSTDPSVGFDIPEDSVPGRIFVAVHYYDWTFGLQENMSDTTFDHADFSGVISDFAKLQEKFTSRGIPVILGEYGAVNKLNDADRAYHMEGVNRLCQQYGVVPVYWDQGWYDLSMEPDYSFALVDRATGEEIYPSIIEAMMRGLFLPGNKNLADIEKEPTVTPITTLGSYSGELSVTVGEVAYVSLAEQVDKSAYNDVVLWKSADETVATVNPDNGDTSVWAADIHGTGIGSTVITAYSHNGQAVLEIPVTVTAADGALDEILIEQDSYTLLEDEYIYLNAGMDGADEGVFLTYRSTDPSVATVSKLGKVVAVSEGRADIVITASNGVSETVSVNVEAGEAVREISLALNVYYNDNGLNYFSNEVGEAITVTEPGQYTLVFDCSTDLSGSAVAAGVTGLNNLTAIYIKDDSVTKGLTTVSPLIACDIVYDEILVDGVSFAITKTDPKSALKASGILDTNDPINSWDGSVIDEVRVSNHVLNFTGVENPQRIQVTFTLSRMAFEGEEIPEAPAVTEAPAKIEEPQESKALGDETPDTAQEPQDGSGAETAGHSGLSSLAIAGIVVLCVALFAGVFLVTLKVAGSMPADGEKKGKEEKSGK